jgi:hypothetical protein
MLAESKLLQFLSYQHQISIFRLHYIIKGIIMIIYVTRNLNLMSGGPYSPIPYPKTSTD